MAEPERATPAGQPRAAEPPRPTPSTAWRWRRAARALLLVLADLSVLFAAGTLAYLAWALPVHGVEGQPPALFLRLALLLPLFVVVFAQAGLYAGIGLGPVETLRRLTLSTLLTFLFLATLNYAFKSPFLYSRATLALSLLFALLLLPASRFALNAAAQRWNWWREPVVLVASTAAAAGALAALRGPLQTDYRPVGLLTPRPETAPGGSPPRLGSLDDLPAAVPPGIHVAVVPDSPDLPDLDRLNLYFRRVVLLRLYGHMPVEGSRVRNLGGMVGIEYVNSLLLTHNRVLKRSLDLLLGSALLLLAAPVIALACLAVKAVDRGPAFFVQRRTGLDGQPIAIPKVRTMRVDAERRLEEHLRADPELAREWEDRRKLTRDPRILPKVGRFLRRFSVDELPQLWSVVRGEMSLVGPRPFPEDHLRLFSDAFRGLRQRVRPGITGLWQVTVRSEGGIAEQEAADSHYIRNWSLWLDLYILGRTLGTVIRGKGAY